MEASKQQQQEQKAQVACKSLEQPQVGASNESATGSQDDRNDQNLTNQNCLQGSCSFWQRVGWLLNHQRTCKAGSDCGCLLSQSPMEALSAADDVACCASCSLQTQPELGEWSPSPPVLGLRANSPVQPLLATTRLSFARRNSSSNLSNARLLRNQESSLSSSSQVQLPVQWLARSGSGNHMNSLAADELRAATSAEIGRKSSVTFRRPRDTQNLFSRKLNDPAVERHPGLGVQSWLQCSPKGRGGKSRGGVAISVTDTDELSGRAEGGESTLTGSSSPSESSASSEEQLAECTRGLRTAKSEKQLAVEGFCEPPKRHHSVNERPGKLYVAPPVSLAQVENVSTRVHQMSCAESCCSPTNSLSSQWSRRQWPSRFHFGG